VSDFAPRAYLDRLIELLTVVRNEDLDVGIDAGGCAIADTLMRGGLLHVFGTGHSHLLALELFYRAGGLAAVDPILIESLMLHVSASRSTLVERENSHMDRIRSRYHLAAGDTLLVISNSGGNAAPVELAAFAKAKGLGVIALTSLSHAASGAGRQASSLQDIAHIVLDNHGVPGDAAVQVAGLGSAMGPTSTVVGAAIVNALAIRAAERMIALGATPDVFVSANVRGGDQSNAGLVKAYADRIGAL
jgi:uncharacterized phosphosugar-binding protein